MKSEDFLLYPLANEDQPNCPACGKPMAIVLRRAGKSLFGICACVPGAC
jgi:ssDNA-binding Zn-finger/Zn-ribbon topoisomerase 1